MKFVSALSLLLVSVLLLEQLSSSDAAAFVPTSFAASSSSSSSMSSKASVAQHPHVAHRRTFHHQQQQRMTSTTQLHSAVDSTQLTNFFLETLISTGVPATVTCAVIAFAANAFRSNKENRDKFSMGANDKNPASELYSDLYGDDDSKNPFGRKNADLSSLFGSSSSKQKTNLGIPAQEYITINKLNTKLDSYKYTMTAATQSKALAASQIRSTNFANALQTGMDSSALELTAFQKSKLLASEKEFLLVGSRLLGDIQRIQTDITRMAIDEEMEGMGVSTETIDTKPLNQTALDATTNGTATTDDKKKNSNRNSKSSDKNKAAWKDLSSLQQDLIKLELLFVKDVITTTGPERANGLRGALLGDAKSDGAPGGLLTKLQERPLSAIFSQIDDSSGDSSHTNSNRKKSLFVAQFPGDTTASQVNELREEVTAICRSAQPGDEALLILQSGGGTVTGYGLAAAQLQRFKNHDMKLTIAVEQVAASGGYMMCCVADKIVASPFAVLGSIGVISDIPNAYERLKEEGIEFQTITAGKFKRTITPTKKVTKEDITKTTKELEGILDLFKAFVAGNRPSLDIDRVATGETWFGSDALDMGLCDEIKPVDDVLMEYVDQGYNVYDVKYAPPQKGVSTLADLLPSTSANSGPVGSAVRWLVRTVASELTTEFKNMPLGDLGSSSSSVQKTYMMKDDTAENYRVQE